MLSRISTWSRQAFKVKQFAQGERINRAMFNDMPFNNKYQKLVQMYQARVYHENNTPYQLQCDKLTQERANLQKQLNFLHARLFMKRIILLYSVILFYFYFIKEEEARDWGDRFDVKFNIKAYGALDDSSGEGNTAIDD